jgi:RHS repeat-associated protein
VLRGSTLLATYVYDYRGLRARKVTTAAAPQGAQVVRYVYDEAGHLAGEVGATGAPIRTYIWADDKLYAQIDHTPTDKEIYFEVDHLGTPRAALDQSGKVVWTWESDAFGAIQPNQNPSGMGVQVVNLRFPGQYYDQETGLFYNMHRYYDPTMGQFVQSDPIGLRGGGLKGGSWSTYTYVSGNPLRYIDPLGLDVTVYDYYNEVGGAGHIGIAVNNNPSVGFYPNDSSTEGVRNFV